MAGSTSIHKSNIMTLLGNGKVTAIPDVAVLRLGVQTETDNLTYAQSENARISQAVLEVLNDMGVTDIKTFQYNIDKIFDFVEGQRIDRGYRVRNIFEIRTENMNQIGTIIDSAVNSGANVVDFINFEVSDATSYYLQALNLAVMDAYQKAKSIAQSMRLTLDPVPLNITENTQGPIPLSRSFTAGESAFTTPIEPGNLVIEASVTVEFTY